MLKKEKSLFQQEGPLYYTLNLLIAFNNSWLASLSASADFAMLSSAVNLLVGRSADLFRGRGRLLGNG